MQFKRLLKVLNRIICLPFFLFFKKWFSITDNFIEFKHF